MSTIAAAFAQKPERLPQRRMSHSDQSPSAVGNVLQQIQRKTFCACGGGCPRCQETPAIQAKLEVSTPGDIFEQEADQVADRVMRMPEPAPIGATTSEAETEQHQIQRRANSEAGTGAVVTDITSRLGAGAPLDTASRSYFEPRFGHNFDHVRVHADSYAANTAEAINARAFTLGSHIVMGAGEYQPQSTVGKRLLAHELTHVVQQSARGVGLVQRDVWWRGEGVDVPRVGHGPVVHDLGEGLYFSEHVEVAIQYAESRGGASGSGMRLLTADIPETMLGRVLDLTRDPRWQGYLDMVADVTGRSAGEILRSGEPYWNSVENFLRQNDININDYDTIIGEEYLRGGRQMCIRNPQIQTTVQSILRPAPIIGAPGEALAQQNFRVNTRTTVLNAVREGSDTIVELEVRFVEGLEEFNRTAGTRVNVTVPERMVVRVRMNAQNAFVSAEAVEGPAVLAEAIGRQAVRTVPIAAAEGEAVALGTAGAAAGRVPLWFRGLGWAGLIVFVGVTSYQLATASPEERPRIVTQAAGGFASGALGGYVICNVLFGIETVGWSLLGCLFVAGGVTGYAGTEAAGAIYDAILTPSGAVGPWQIPSTPKVHEQDLRVRLITPSSNAAFTVRNDEDTDEFVLAAPGAALVVLSDFAIEGANSLRRALTEDETIQVCIKKDDFWYNPTVACKSFIGIAGDVVPTERRILFITEESGEHFINVEFSRTGIGGVTAVMKVCVYQFRQ